MLQPSTDRNSFETWVLNDSDAFINPETLLILFMCELCKKLHGVDKIPFDSQTIYFY